MRGKTLYFNGELLDYESLKSTEPERLTILGSQIYKESVLKAILEHGTFQRILLPANAASTPTQNSGQTPATPGHPVPAYAADHELGRLLGQDSTLAFFTPDTSLASLARLRRLSRRPCAPITGIIHSLNYSFQPWVMLQLMYALEDHDALICSSSAGRTAVQRLLRLVRNSLEEDGWSRNTTEFEMPVVPLAVDVDSFASVDKTAVRKSLQLPPGPVFLYFGRFSSCSKADLMPLTLAFHHLRSVRSDVVLVIAGDDTQFRLTNDLKRHAENLHESERIRFIPNPDSETKKRLYAGADIFVSPADSVQETFGLSVIEAMAAGLPCIVSEWDGYRDLVVPGETGIRIKTAIPDFDPLFDDFRGSGDMRSPDLLSATTIIDPGELVNAMAGLAGNDEMRRSMGTVARERAKQLFDWRVVIRSYEELWDHLSDKARKRQPKPRSIGLGTDRLPYREIFSHYGSDVLSDRVRVRIMRRPGTYTGLEETNSRWFSQDRIERLMEYLDRAECTEIAAVVNDLSADDPIDRILTKAHLCRLMKYGLVETAH